jgi:hypothetical protein
MAIALPRAVGCPSRCSALTKSDALSLLVWIVAISRRISFQWRRTFPRSSFPGEGVQGGIVGSVISSPSFLVGQISKRRPIVHAQKLRDSQDQIRVHMDKVKRLRPQNAGSAGSMSVGPMSASGSSRRRSRALGGNQAPIEPGGDLVGGGVIEEFGRVGLSDQERVAVVVLLDLLVPETRTPAVAWGFLFGRRAMFETSRIDARGVTTSNCQYLWIG